MELTKFQWTYIIAVLGILEMIALWDIDIALSALLNGDYLTNGFYTKDPMQAYHMGLYLAIFIFVILTGIALYHIKLDGEK